MDEKIKKVFNLDKILKISIIVVVLLIGGLAFYRLIISPSHNRKLLDDCLERAYEKYREEWTGYCRLDKRPIGTDGLCLLSGERAETVKEYYEKLKDECFKKYLQN